MYLRKRVMLKTWYQIHLNITLSILCFPMSPISYMLNVALDGSRDSDLK